MHQVERGRSRWLGRSSILVAAAMVAGLGLSVAPATTALAGPPPVTSICPDASNALFGPNVCVFTPTMTQAAIQNDLNAIATQQVPIASSFDSNRYSVFFEPGTYGSAADPLVFEVGYYEQVAGLGLVPQDTVINGQAEVFPNAPDSAPQCTPAYAGPGQCTGPGQGCYVALGQTCYWANSTDNFWRSLSNLTLNVESSSTATYVPTPLTQQAPINDGNCWVGSTDLWSVSQATPVRSVIINGNLNFQAYCSETNYQSNDYASGSYVANSEINGQLDWSGNQQGVARNSDFESAAGYVWNYVYSGDGCPAGYTPPAGTACSPTQNAFDGTSTITNGTDGINGIDQVTELPQSPVTQEEPFLYIDANGNWNVFVPAVQHNTTGPVWPGPGTSLPLRDFFIANPSTPVLAIDLALALGKDLVLTPGVYNLQAPIVVSRPDTVVLSQGFATLIPQHGNAALIVTPNNGVKVSDLMIDAGAVNSPVLMSVGNPGPSFGSATDPDLIQDMYIRVGGAESPASASIGLLDSAPNSIIDDAWIWRADHGTTATSTGWTTNVGLTGLVVDANNVTAYGLAVEHFQQNEVVWDGNGGSVVFFQNELPYDVPQQSAWMETPTQNGFPSFLVTPNVTTFNGYGMGSYAVFQATGNNDTNVVTDAETYEAPQAPGVVFTDVFSLYIDGPGTSGINTVINGTGGSATSANPTTPVDITNYS